MRFISKHGGYKKVAVHEKVERLADGTSKQIAPGFMCEFTHGDLTNYEREFARTVFTWKGLPTAPGSEQPLDPINDLHRVSAFDTAVVPEVLREQVEQALLSSPSYGQDYVFVEMPKLAAPWPAYDQLVKQGRRTIEMVAEKIAAKVQEDGYDPAQVVAYERQTLNRPEVIAAVEALTVPDPDDELVAA